jgi:hypothetical protein
MHKSLFPMLVSLSLMACFPDPPTGGGGGGGGGVDAAPPADPCTLVTAPGGSTQGFPYDVNDFNTNILPKLQGGCELGGSCHGVGSNPALFQVFSAANVGNGCPEEQTFNQVAARSSYQNGGAMSAIVQKINGTVSHTFSSTAPASVELTGLLTTFIDTAKTNFESGGGGGGGGGGNDAAFDRGVFASQIQPVIDNVGCIGSCHVAGGNAFGNFGLNANARASSPELEANVQAILGKIDLALDPAQATQAKIYVKSTDGHAPAQITNATALTNLESWIAAGLMGQ